MTNDSADESNETVASRSLCPQQCYRWVPTSAATLTITDDDDAPTVQFSTSPTYTVADAGGSATITATLKRCSGLTAP